MKQYSKGIDNVSKAVKAQGSHLKVHFKNTCETAAAISGLKLTKAQQYLQNVIEHKQCVPFRRFNGGIGRCAQAKVFGTTQGRWPVKSAKFLMDLLQNAKSNAQVKKLDVNELVIKHIQVNQAPRRRRRTYRAHGRINKFLGYPCHIEMILTEDYAMVEREKDEPMDEDRLIKLNSRQQARKRLLASRQ